MDIIKKKLLETAGWIVSNVQEFLGLTDQEIETIDKKIRKKKNISQ